MVLFTTLSFDLTITSLFLPLIRGSVLEIFDLNESMEDTFLNYFKKDIASIKLTPAHISYLNNLDVSTCNIEMAIVGGDALHQEHVEILKRLNPSMRIFNEYGPTEATVGAVVHEVKT